MKILLLIIASSSEYYDRMKTILSKYYSNFIDNGIEYYFLYGGKIGQISSSPHDLILDCSDNWTDGITCKTILACQKFQTTDFDYVIRTNLSSIFNIPLLIKMIQDLPRTKCYCGFIGYDNGPFVSGAGIFMSSDCVEILAKCDLTIIPSNIPDDIYIRNILSKYCKPFQPIWYTRQINNCNGNNIIQYRFKSENRLQDAELLEKIADDLQKRRAERTVRPFEPRVLIANGLSGNPIQTISRSSL